MKNKNIAGNVKRQQPLDEARAPTPRYSMKKWWKNDPEILLNYVYWANNKPVPTDSELKRKAWEKVVNKLDSRKPAPDGEYDKAMQHIFR